MMQRLWWNITYWLGKTPWDTGITPPEVCAAVEGGLVPPGRALDLGCGTGTNVIYLARHGFEVIGVDISSRAIGKARHKIEQAGQSPKAHVYAGDVTRLDTLPIAGPFDLGLDIGCFHNLDLQVRPGYVKGLASRMRSGGLYLLYAFGPLYRGGRRVGLAPEEAERLFVPCFDLLRVDHGQDRGGIGSAWYTLRKGG